MFQGFSPETIDFLWGIRMNNNREWFEKHKQDYIGTLYQPMKDLAADIFEPFQDIPGFYCKTSRIYRDMRMHPDTPYKESLWICIRRDAEWWQWEPSLFFELTPDRFAYGFLFWSPTVAMMNEMRKDMLAHPEDFLKLIRTVERDSGIKVCGNSYVRKKNCPNEKIDAYYQFRNMFAIHEEPICEKLFSPELAETVRQKLQALYPLCEYCQKFTSVR